VVCNTCVLSARTVRGTRLFCSRRRPRALQDTLEKISVVLLLGAAIRFAAGKVCDLHDWTYVTAIPNRGAFNNFCSSIIRHTLFLGGLLYSLIFFALCGQFNFALHNSRIDFLILLSATSLSHQNLPYRNNLNPCDSRNSSTVL
jgi:hypothetical protein